MPQAKGWELILPALAGPGSEAAGVSPTFPGCMANTFLALVASDVLGLIFIGQIALLAQPGFGVAHALIKIYKGLPAQ